MYRLDEFEIGSRFSQKRGHNGQNGRLLAIFFIHICKTRPDRYSITIERNVWFQVGIYCQKCQLDQIENGRPVATFDFNMHNNWKTVPDS